MRRAPTDITPAPSAGGLPPRIAPAVRPGGHRRDQRPETEVGLDLLEVWGTGSFPASDPPANW